MRCLCMLLLWGASAAPQERLRLTGVVQDATGGVLVDVGVVAMDEASGVRYSGYTGPDGAYSLRLLKPGTYKVTARKAGFRTVARLNVEATAPPGAHVDFVLPVGSLRDTITIEGTRPLVDDAGGSVGATADRAWIGALPLSGRAILGLLETAPGVLATPASSGEAGQFSVNGQRPNTNHFLVDGTSANGGLGGSSAPAQFSGGSLPSMTAFGSTHTLAPLDALEEVRIETSSFAPEFGRLPGAQVILTTRTGSDEFHGSVAYQLRNQALNANDWVANSMGYGRLPDRLNQWQAALGGPVRRGRTYFFAAYEGLRLNQSHVWRAATPSANARRDAAPAYRQLLEAFPASPLAESAPGLSPLAARASRPAALDSGSLRLDHAWNPWLTVFGRYQQSPSSSDFGLAQVARSSFQSRRLTLGATAAAGGVINDLRFTASGTSAMTVWQPDPTQGARVPDWAGLVPPAPGVRDALYGLAIGGVGQIISGEGARNRQGQSEFSDSLAMRRGAHDLRIGVDYERLTPERQSTASAVALSFPSLAGAMAGTPPLVTRYVAQPASSLIETLSLYFQDTWAISPRLTLTWGTRWEVTPMPSIREESGHTVVSTTVPRPVTPDPVPTVQFAGATVRWPTRLTQFAPRAGLARRFGNRSVLRAGWGIFYDLGFSAATDAINGLPFNRWEFSRTLAAGGTFDTLSGYLFAERLELPRSHHWNVAWETQLSGADAFSLSYVGSASRRLLRREGQLAADAPIAAVAVATNHGRADYHGLEAHYRRRMRRNLQASVAYTWSHSIDNGSWDSALALVPSDDRGSSSFDVRHSATAAMNWQFARGWTLQSILRARTGFPIDVRVGENLLGLGFDNITRPDLVPGVPLWLTDAGAPGGRRLNPAAFARPGGRPQGNLGRNAMAGFGMAQVDLALKRRFTVTERMAVEFGATAFNALNHASFADPVPYLQDSQFGRSNSMLNLMLGRGTAHSGLAPAFQVGGSRLLEVSLKATF